MGHNTAGAEEQEDRKEIKQGETVVIYAWGLEKIENMQRVAERIEGWQRSEVCTSGIIQVLE